MTQVVIYVRFVKCQFFSPDQCVWKGTTNDFRIAATINALQPREVLQPIIVGDFGFIHVKGWDCDAPRNVVPIVGQVIFDLAHREGSSFNKDQSRGRFLLKERLPFKSSVSRIVVGPSCGAGTVSDASCEEECTKEHHGGCELPIHFL